MTKLDLTMALSLKTGLPVCEAQTYTDALLNILADKMAAGEEITLRGLFSIRPVMSNPKPARNLRTGERITVPARMRLRFAPAIALLNKLRETTAQN